MKFNIKCNDIKNEIKFNNIVLSTYNPRYTTLKSLDEDLIRMISDLDNKDEKNTMIELLKNEGDLSDLKNLFESIKNIGFDSSTEKIILIQSNEKFVVAEGNRRIMALKMISNNLTLPESIAKIDSLEIKEDFHNDEEVTHQNYIEKKEANFKNIKNIISNIQEKDKEINVDVQLVETSDQLWKEIYTKHIAGNRPGMRTWSRGKYFTDILSFFKNGINIKSEINIKIRTHLRREPNTIIDDFKHAQFVKAIIKSSKNLNSNEQISDTNIYKTMKKTKVSALQHNFSLGRITNSATNFLKINTKDFKNKYFEFKYDKNNIIDFFKDKHIKYEKLLNFIWKHFENGTITTRSISTNKQDDFDRSVKLLLNKNDIMTNEKQSEKTLKDLDSFDYSINQLEEIISNAKQNNINEKIIKKYEITKNIKTENNKFKKINNVYLLSNDKEPSSVFKRLNDQYIFNQDKQNFLNAAAATLRSMLEQILLWGVYFNDDVLKKIDSKNPDNFKELYIDELAKGKISGLFSKIKNNYFEKDHISNYIKNISKNDSNLEDQVDFIKQNKKDVNDVLNEFIHASHRIYTSNSFHENLEKFNKWQNVILEIIENIDNKKIDVVNAEIKKSLDKLNENVK